MYRAVRVGQRGEQFTLLKFRTMSVGVPGPRVAMNNDARVTPGGRWLRQTRLDEIPQLLNVIAGSMSLVGPRPEDPAFFDPDDALHWRVVAARPGLTSPASLAHLDERLRLEEGDAAERYVDAIQPAKLQMELDYVEGRFSIWRDVRILFRTLVVLARRVMCGREG